jgi:uncharacterized membrane protein
MTLLFLQTTQANYYSILLLILGLFIRYQIGRRRFKRKAITGIQLYRSYYRGVITTIIETLLNIIGTLCMVIAIIAIIMHL